MRLLSFPMMLPVLVEAVSEDFGAAHRAGS